ncbi:cell proliferation protein [Starmerella bacillaris]|uniref:Cell proliferation protein n=1 Tax=Starmerella bacillaris TaxID=1247836 RepID=A0AAV5RN66_STABA|nr:cell proliferation protein [Starmerella bacillaris]
MSQFANFEFQNWYPLFKHVSPKARVLVAPEQFREYLLSDGLLLHTEESDSETEWNTPETEIQHINKKRATDSAITNSSASDNDNIKNVKNIKNNINDNDSESDSDSVEASSFLKKPPAEFHTLIEQAIAELDGAVMPKLNWSAPRDAAWMLPGNSLKCINANDIYSALKSSDYIVHDLQLQPENVVLVLRQWFDLHPATEFRCFVNNGELIAISQRDMNYYDFLESRSSQIIDACKVLASTIVSKFPENMFVFDIHLTKKDKAFLIDINPWNEKTDSILFTWDELNLENTSTTESAVPELRLVSKEDRTRTFSSKPHSTSQVPADFVDMEKGDLQDLIEQMKAQRAKEA